MATGGTGDLLTGMIAAWFAQLLDAEAACKLAVYLHGTAGDLAEADEGEVALIAGDIAARLGDAILELTRADGRRSASRERGAVHDGERRGDRRRRRAAGRTLTQATRPVALRPARRRQDGLRPRPRGGLGASGG